MCRACPELSRYPVRPTMPVTRMLLRMLAHEQGTVSVETHAILARNLQRAAGIIRTKGQVVPAALAGDVLELAFELADEPELVDRLHRLNEPHHLDAPLATEILAALGRFARA